MPKHGGDQGGRPKKLHADDATLAALRSLGEIQATVREGAAFFKVTHPTFEKFLNEPGVRDVWEDGKADGRMSLRRKQVQLALAGNATMLIWLGKNLLDQTDKAELSGPGGTPMIHKIELVALESPNSDTA